MIMKSRRMQDLTVLELKNYLATAKNKTIL